MDAFASYGAGSTLTRPPQRGCTGTSTPQVGFPAIILDRTSDEPLVYSCERLHEEYHKSQVSHVAPLRYCLRDGSNRFVKLDGPFKASSCLMGSIDSDPLGQFTVYNPSGPVNNQIAVRFEPLEVEKSTVIMCSYRNGVCTPDTGLSFLNAQDPFLKKIVSFGYSYIVLSFNRITEMEPDGIGVRSWRQEFYRYDNQRIPDEPFAIGLPKQKCGRVGDPWLDGLIPVFGRVQGSGYGMGKLTYTEITSLEELQESLSTAPLLPGVFLDEEWGGINDTISLNSNRYLGVYAHIARFNPRKDYYGIRGIFDRKRRQIIEMEMFLDANDFPFKVAVKKHDLNSIVYIGGVQPRGKMHQVFGGCGDTGSFTAMCQCNLFERYYGRS